MLLASNNIFHELGIDVYVNKSAPFQLEITYDIIRYI